MLSPLVPSPVLRHVLFYFNADELVIVPKVFSYMLLVLWR